MMHRRHRTYLTSSLLGLYVVAVLCGLALHHHGKGPASPSQAESPAVAQAAQVEASHDDCPTCHFLAQTHLSIRRDGVGSAQDVRARPPDPIPLTFPDAPARLDRARAPPHA